MRKFIGFLTSRGFAISLLIVSAGLLLLWNRYPAVYSPLFLIIPSFIFLSIALCTVKRAIARGLGKDIRFWGSAIFHIAMLIVIAATSIGHLTRFSAVAALPQGMTVNMLNGDFVSVDSTSFMGEIPFISMRLEWQKSQYKGGWLPTDHSAGLKIGYMEGNSFRTVNETIGINSPIKKNGYEFLLDRGNLSPLFILKDTEGKILFNQFADLSNETGAEDTFEIPKRDLTVYTRFFPDVFKEDGKYKTLSKNPDNPAFGLRIGKKDDPFKDIWKGVLKPGEKAEFNSMTLEFADLRPVVTIRISKDPTYWGIMAGWILIVAGLVVRYIPFLARKKDVK